MRNKTRRAKNRAKLEKTYGFIHKHAITLYMDAVDVRKLCMYSTRQKIRASFQAAFFNSLRIMVEQRDNGISQFYESPRKVVDFIIQQRQNLAQDLTKTQHGILNHVLAMLGALEGKLIVPNTDNVLDGLEIIPAVAEGFDID